MNYNEIVEVATHYGLTKEKAEDFAMRMHLQGISQEELIISALRLICHNNTKKDA